MRWHAQVLQASGLRGEGLDAFWAQVTRFRDLQRASGQDIARRHRQDEAWMWERIESGLRDAFRQHEAVRRALPDVARRVRRGELVASVAARQLLALFETPSEAQPAAAAALDAMPCRAS